VQFHLLSFSLCRNQAGTEAKTIVDNKETELVISSECGQRESTPSCTVASRKLSIGHSLRPGINVFFLTLAQQAGYKIADYLRVGVKS
jgi:hypothetical protein